MNDTESSDSITGAARRFIHRLLAVGENRFQLLLVEVEQERNRLVDMFLMSVVAGGLGLLAGIAWSAALVIWVWPSHPALALLILGAIYVAAAGVICRRLVVLRRHLQALAATLEQLRKDSACFSEN
jgi:uncharacterized membrane protein YqjE